jgi:serpin B
MKYAMNPSLGIFSVLLIVFGMTCTKNGVIDPQPVPVDKDDIITQTQGAITIKKYNADRDTAPDISIADVSSLSEGNTAFAIDLYKKLSDSSQNVFYSPYSISIALAMTWGGARNQTEQDMAAVLHFPFPQTKLHAAFNALDLALNRHAQTGGFELHIANQVWGEKTYAFMPDYLKLVDLNYGAAMRLLDFIGNPEPSRLVINTWVSGQTNQRINDLIPQGGINGDTRFVLTNAIYFKAQWADTFFSNTTADGIFHRSGSETATAKFMSREGSYAYASTADYQAIELPYKGRETSMLIIMPATGKMAQVEAGLSSDFFTTLNASMKSSGVFLRLPKFKFTTGSIGLADILKSLGMEMAFSDQADFTGINGTGGLCISDVIHKAFVAVDEKGTEAAAATAVSVGTTSMPAISLSIDRPFIFLIRDVQTNTILFMGKLNDPTTE